MHAHTNTHTTRWRLYTHAMRCENVNITITFISCTLMTLHVYNSFGYIDDTTLLIQKSIPLDQHNFCFHKHGNNLYHQVLHQCSTMKCVWLHITYWNSPPCATVLLCTKTHEHRYTYIILCYTSVINCIYTKSCQFSQVDNDGEVCLVVDLLPPAPRWCSE